MTDNIVTHVKVKRVHFSTSHWIASGCLTHFLTFTHLQTVSNHWC